MQGFEEKKTHQYEFRISDERVLPDIRSFPHYRVIF